MALVRVPCPMFQWIRFYTGSSDWTQGSWEGYAVGRLLLSLAVRNQGLINYALITGPAHSRKRKVLNCSMCVTRQTLHELPERGLGCTESQWAPELTGAGFSSYHWVQGLRVVRRLIYGGSGFGS